MEGFSLQVMAESNPAHPDYGAYVRKTASTIAAQFRESKSQIEKSYQQIEEACAMMSEAAKTGKGDLDCHLGSFEIHLQCAYVNRRQTVEEIIDAMRRHVWRVIILRLGIKSTMSIEGKRKLDEQIEKGDVPELTEESIISMIFGMADNVNTFMTKAVREIFDYLRPMNSGLKTNSTWKIGPKVILTRAVDDWTKSGRFSVSYYCRERVAAMEGVFRMLDGVGLARDNDCEFDLAVRNSVGGVFDTTYFFGRCYQNGNVHITFKRMDLVNKINACAAGENVLRKAV